jgi:hypothetical protein
MAAIAITVTGPAPGLVVLVFLVLVLLLALFHGGLRIGAAHQSPDTQGGEFTSKLVPLHLVESRLASHNKCNTAVGCARVCKSNYSKEIRQNVMRNICQSM